MESTKIPEELRSLPASIRSTAATIASQDWEKLGGSEHAKPEQLRDLVDLVVKPTADDLKQIVDRPDDELVNLGFVSLKLLEEGAKQLHIAVKKLRERWERSRLEPHLVDQVNAATTGEVFDLCATANRHFRLCSQRLAFNDPEIPRVRALVEVLQAERRLAFEARNEQAQAADELRAKVEAALNDAETALVKGRAAAADEGVLRQTRAFRLAVRSHRAASQRWLVTSIVLAAVMLLGVWLTIQRGEGPPLRAASWTAAANLSFFAVRALGVSVISYLLVSSVRNYRASRHNEIINAHRWGALTTFEQFRIATSGATSDVVLVQASQAIYASQPTGFADLGPTEGTHLAELVAMLKPQSGKPPG